MNWTIPDLCDEFPDAVKVLEPLFTDFGARRKYCGEIITIKCFEDNSLVKATVQTPGGGRIMVVDGGGSLRCALLGDMLADAALANDWSGLLINGCVRDVEILRTIDLGVRALRAHPLKSEKRGEGQMNIPLHFAGVNFLPGQYFYADENGLMISSSCLHET